MRIRVKAADHINLDGLTPAQLSIIMSGLEIVKAQADEKGDFVRSGLSSNLINEIRDAIDEVGEIIQGPAKEARRKRKLEEAESLRQKSGIDAVMEKCRREMAELETPLEALSVSEDSGTVILGTPIESATEPVMVEASADRCD